MMKSVFHVGYMKTGSTFLQNVIFAKANSLFFPRHSYAEDTHYLINEILTVSELEYSYDHARRSFHDLQNKSPKTSETLVMSEELLTGDLIYPYTVSTKEYCDRLKKLDSNAKIIIFIRNQPSMLLTLYKEYLQQGGTNRISGFLKQEGFNRLLTQRLNYYYLINYYEDVFGCNNVFLACYEQLRDEATRTILDMLNFASDQTHESLSQHGLEESDLERRINVGTSQRFLGLARILNRYRKSRLNPSGIVSNESWRMFKAIDRRLSGFRATMSNESVAPIILDFAHTHFSVSNALLAQSYPHLNLEGRGYSMSKVR